MMKVSLDALDPEEGTDASISITEWLWRPVCSIMAIANHRQFEKTGSLPFRYDFFEDIDCNCGYYTEYISSCKRISEEMIFLARSPEVLEEYGMTVELEDGEFIYTYPISMCTSAIEDRETEKIVVTPGDHKKDNLRNVFRIKEKDLVSISKFIGSCGGFNMP